jgi:hypothetical protein
MIFFRIQHDHLKKYLKSSQGNDVVKSAIGKARESGGMRPAFAQAAATTDEAQRCIRTFYGVISH